MTIHEKLDAINEIFCDFRPNTSIDTIIRHYEAILKEQNKKEK